MTAATACSASTRTAKACRSAASTCTHPISSAWQSLSACTPTVSRASAALSAARSPSSSGPTNPMCWWSTRRSHHRSTRPRAGTALLDKHHHLSAGSVLLHVLVGFDDLAELEHPVEIRRIAAVGDSVHDLLQRFRSGGSLVVVAVEGAQFR